MKKVLLAMCLMFMSMQSVNAQLLTAALHHQGKVTIYGSDKLSTAMNDAVAGDTLYLSEGSFPNALTITKAIRVIGVGSASTGIMTEVRGGISVAIPDGVSHTGCQIRDIRTTTLTVSKAVDSLNVSKCVFSGETNFNAATSHAYFDRCQFLSVFWLSTNISDTEIVASKLKDVRGAASNATDAIFTNCNIRLLNNYYSMGVGAPCLATYLNSVIGKFTSTSWSYMSANTTYINCLCGSDFYTFSTYQDCWTNSNITFDDDDNVTLASGSLSDYIGSDGTVVGCTGSANPFTLVPNTPHLTDINLDVDNKSKKLTVTMTVE